MARSRKEEKMSCDQNDHAIGDILTEISSMTINDFQNKIEEYRIKLNIPKEKTYVMPAGDTREQLIKMYPIVFEMVAEHGYNISGRDHIIAYDTERGV